MRPAVSRGIWIWNRFLLALALAMVGVRVTVAAPVEPPDFASCNKIDVFPGFTMDCCIPYEGVEVKDWRFKPEEPMRVRRAAHLVDEEYMEKYNRAYELMRALPSDDPRSLTVQQKFHCGHCGAIYNQRNSSKTYNVHRTWLFFPFHRWFMYFHERIIRSLIGDDSFALPYWAWDSQAILDPLPNAIPLMFEDEAKYPGLARANRDARHRYPAILDLTLGTHYEVVADSEEELRDINNAVMHQSVVSLAGTASLFMSPAYRAGDSQPEHASNFERGPHGAVHTWCGDPRKPLKEDLGHSYSSAQDPIFFAHHANVDRLWNIWKSLDGGRALYDDPDWLESSFEFFDETGALVRVRVADGLDHERLGYSYEEITNTWIDYKPNPALVAKYPYVYTEAFLPTAYDDNDDGSKDIPALQTPAAHSSF